MKIVVCIKQVPGTSQVEIDPETGVLKRDGAALYFCVDSFCLVLPVI